MIRADNTKNVYYPLFYHDVTDIDINSIQELEISCSCSISFLQLKQQKRLLKSHTKKRSDKQSIKKKTRGIHS